jgi:uncharacterized protein YegL
MNDKHEMIVFGTQNFADNPEPRCPCLLLIDTSSSMAGEPIHQLNEGLHIFLEELRSDSMAMKRVDVAIVSFGPVNIRGDFTEATNFVLPQLEANGDTPMGSAIVQGLELLRRRKDQYRENGIKYFRPWVFLLTDGSPTDGKEIWTNATNLVESGEDSNAFSFFSVGVGNANMAILASLNRRREPLRLKGLSFRELFVWLSGSLRIVSRSMPGTVVPLESPKGWAQI